MTIALLALGSIELGRVWGKIQDFALDPVRNTGYYFFPCLASISSKFTQLALDIPVRHLMSDEVKKQIITKIQDLGKSALLPRKFNIYTCLNQPSMSYGGFLSITRPIVVIPYELLISYGRPFYEEARAGDNLLDDNHRFTNKESLFLIAHELCHLKSSDAAFKTAAKILLIAAVAFMFASPFGWAVNAAIITGSFLISLCADRHYESTMDFSSVSTFNEANDDIHLSFEAAISALDKIKNQNLAKLKEGKFYQRIFITKKGNDLLDLKHPFITSRIAALADHLKHLKEVRLKDVRNTVPIPVQS
ncbi:MAG: hypothetical protein HW387_19 [Parachlamydiales bacterium]|nr:hypothetical protein [Parachlamydiales bacterium]